MQPFALNNEKNIKSRHRVYAADVRRIAEDKDLEILTDWLFNPGDILEGARLLWKA